MDSKSVLEKVKSFFLTLKSEGVPGLKARIQTATTEIKTNFKADEGAVGVKKYQSCVVNLWRSGVYGKTALISSGVLLLLVFNCLLGGGDSTEGLTAQEGLAASNGGSAAKAEDCLPEDKVTCVLAKYERKSPDDLRRLRTEEYEALCAAGNGDTLYHKYKALKERNLEELKKVKCDSDLALGFIASLADYSVKSPVNSKGVMPLILFEHLLAAAQAGNPDAQSELGDVYFGYDEMEAFKWHLSAAKQGCAYSMMRVGDLYDVAGVVKQNNEKTVEWFNKAIARYTEDTQEVAEKGSEENNRVQANIGRMKNRMVEIEANNKVRAEIAALATTDDRGRDGSEGFVGGRIFDHTFGELLEEATGDLVTLPVSYEPAFLTVDNDDLVAVFPDVWADEKRRIPSSGALLPSDAVAFYDFNSHRLRLIQCKHVVSQYSIAEVFLKGALNVSIASSRGVDLKSSLDALDTAKKRFDTVEEIINEVHRVRDEFIAQLESKFNGYVDVKREDERSWNGIKLCTATIHDKSGQKEKDITISMRTEENYVLVEFRGAYRSLGKEKELIARISNRCRASRRVFIRGMSVAGHVVGNIDAAAQGNWICLDWDPKKGMMVGYSEYLKARQKLGTSDEDKLRAAGFPHRNVRNFTAWKLGSARNAVDARDKTLGKLIAGRFLYDQNRQKEKEESK